jgi:c-di-GMP-related signal transduction protein
LVRELPLDAVFTIGGGNMAREVATSATTDTAHPGPEKYLARQPIFDRRESLFGYELLLRAGLENYFKAADPERVSELVVDNYLLFGIDTLTGGRRAFVNFNREALVRDYASLLPRERIVVEILEDVRPDTEVLAACRRLKRSGYLIALDDFLTFERSGPLISFADIVKVDFQRTTENERRIIAECLGARGVKLLAEKVEQPEDVQKAMEMGYTLFQGFFYCRPQILMAREVPGFRPNYIRMIRAVNRRDLDLREIEQILKQEPSLLFKLLRYLNSAYFYLCQEVTSIRHALALLGEENIRKWTFVVAMVDLAKDRPDELVAISLVRARFCELAAQRLKQRNREIDLFLLGLLSTLDAIVGRALPSLLQEMPVAEELKIALQGGNNRFRHILDLVLAYEHADWQQVRACAEILCLNEAEVPDWYLQSVEWTRRIFRS